MKKRIIIAWIKKKLRIGIASPSYYFRTGYLYEYDELKSRKNKESKKNKTRWKRVYPNIIGKRFFDGGEYGLGFFTVLKAWKCKTYSKSAYALDGTQWFDKVMILIKTDKGIKYKIPFCPWLDVYDEKGKKHWGELFDKNPW